jgi:hypothetical protein
VWGARQKQGGMAAAVMVLAEAACRQQQCGWGIGWRWNVQQERALVEDGQTPVQALDLDEQAGIAEAVASRPQLQHLAGETQGVSAATVRVYLHQKSQSRSVSGLIGTSALSALAGGTAEPSPVALEIRLVLKGMGLLEGGHACQTELGHESVLMDAPGALDVTLACGELAAMDSMPSSASTRPTWVG